MSEYLNFSLIQPIHPSKPDCTFLCNTLLFATFYQYANKHYTSCIYKTSNLIVFVVPKTSYFILYRSIFLSFIKEITNETILTFCRNIERPYRLFLKMLLHQIKKTTSCDLLYSLYYKVLNQF
jgi:hypothetical protein